jgi:hypothetical protein
MNIIDFIMFVVICSLFFAWVFVSSSKIKKIAFSVISVLPIVYLIITNFTPVFFIFAILFYMILILVSLETFSGFDKVSFAKILPLALLVFYAIKYKTMPIHKVVVNTNFLLFSLLSILLVFIASSIIIFKLKSKGELIDE